MPQCKTPFRVVVVDDDPLHNQLLTSILQQGGYEARACDSGRAALAEIGRGCDCLITDYHMPGMDGVQLMRAVRGPGAPACVLLTGSATGSIDQEAIAAGAAAVLHKPTDPSAILGLLSTISSGLCRTRGQAAPQLRFLEEKSRAAAATGFSSPSR